MIVWFIVAAVAAAMVGGALVYRKNAAKAEAVVADVKAVVAKVEDVAKKA
jgi:hypothetical protein